MSNAAIDGGIYHNGRTHAEHVAWLDSLTGDEYRIVHTPCGYLFDLAIISELKYALLNVKMTAHERLRGLDTIARCVRNPVTEAAVAAIEPACETGRKMLREIHSLPVEKQTSAFNEGDVFRLLAKLNSSLLAALKLCTLGTVPKEPRHLLQANVIKPNRSH
jgi:hypothetical protein